MISERQFASGFSSFWSELFPLLTPACVTVFNESHGANIGDGLSVDRRLPGIAGVKIPADVLSESAFELTKAAKLNGIRVVEAFDSPDLRIAAWDAGVKRVAMHRNVAGLDCPDVGMPAGQFFRELSANYDIFFDAIKPLGEVEFSPAVPGCGFLSAMAADLSVGSTLFEVKTVARNFASKDIRQAIIYLAIDHCSGVRRWSSACLFNPRRSRTAEFNPDRFISYISGGRSAASVYRDIEEFLGARDVQFDRKF